MATKKTARVIEATEDLVGLVDQAADVNNRMKELTFQDKAFKVKITEAMSEKFQKGETGLRVTGTTADAVVAITEKASIVPAAPRFAEVQQAIESGLLGDLVDVKKELRVSQDKIADAWRVLEAAGIPSSIDTAYVVKAKELHGPAVRTGNQTHDKAVEALEESIEVGKTFSVTFEWR
jgi:hypothetical protein